MHALEQRRRGLAARDGDAHRHEDLLGLPPAIAELGIYPAVDPLDSTSRILDPNVIGMDHYMTARAVQRLLQNQVINTLRAGPPPGDKKSAMTETELTEWLALFSEKGTKDKSKL